MPWEAFFYLGVDTRVVLLCTPEAPGDNTLQLPVAHNGAAGVALVVQRQSGLVLSPIMHLFNSRDPYLAGVLASLQESGTEHGLGDHAGVGAVTVLLRQDGDFQALQFVTVGRCGAAEPEIQ